MSNRVGAAGTVASATKWPIGSSLRLTRMVGVPPAVVMPMVADEIWISLGLVGVGEEGHVEFVRACLVGIEVHLREPAVLQMDRIQRRQAAEPRHGDDRRRVIVVTCRCTSVELSPFSTITATSQMPAMREIAAARGKAPVATDGASQRRLAELRSKRLRELQLHRTGAHGRAGVVIGHAEREVVEAGAPRRHRSDAL